MDVSLSEGVIPLDTSTMSPVSNGAWFYSYEKESGEMSLLLANA
jgi:hypothetical protein